MDKTKVTKDKENNTLIIERVFDAPKEKLWQFYADKEKFESWWGPEGWETTTKEFDFKPGGRIHYAMKCVDENQKEWFGMESWGLMEIVEINEPNGFIADDYFVDAEGSKDETQSTQRFDLQFIEEGGKTRMVNKSIAKDWESIEKLIKMGMIEGFSSQLNKLEKLLAEK